MPVTHVNSSFLSMLAEAGLVAKFVLFLLLSASVLCWAIILSKWNTLRKVQQQNQDFIQAFWSGKNMDELVSSSEHYPHSSVASIFKSGIKELQKFSASDPNGQSSTDRTDNLLRALLRASNTEISGLEKNVSWLATTASAAPFVGLFGTVWGIMNSFQSIGASGAANLAVVAPGISEALITTATGIAAAIPAVIAYNSFAGRIKKIAIEMECFSQDFINIIQRSFISNRKGH